jgi:hypothetical protein
MADGGLGRERKADTPRWQRRRMIARGNRESGRGSQPLEDLIRDVRQGSDEAWLGGDADLGVLRLYIVRV